LRRPEPARDMKLAGSSASFDAALAAGDLTQLEWLDLCARELALDGVVFEARHFPRTDDEYLAQLKKMAADLGLSVAGLGCDALLASGASGDTEGAEGWLEIAAALGAPLVVSRAPALQTADGPAAWNDVVAAAKAAARAAKRTNVTVAVRNAPATLCAGGSELKRLAKDVDSAWLRFALDVAALDPPEPTEALLPKTVAAAHISRSIDALGADESDVGAVFRALGDFRAFLVVDYLGPTVESERLARLYHWLRRMVAKETLAREGE
jgi:hypothetical protein